MSRTIYQSRDAVITETSDTFVFHDPCSADCVVFERPAFLEAFHIVFLHLTIQEQREITQGK